MKFNELKETLKDLKNTLPNTISEAFIDDIIIMSNDIDQLKKAYVILKEKLKKLQMNLNPKKCEILSENQNDLIVDEEENITLYSKTQTKYLG